MLMDARVTFALENMQRLWDRSATWRVCPGAVRNATLMRDLPVVGCPSIHNAHASSMNC